MAEEGSGFESVEVVAAFTGGGKGFLVIILMAGCTVCFQAQVGIFLFPDRGLPYVLGFMTILAGFFCMRTFQGIAGFVVVELVRVKTNDLEGPAVMIAMAAVAAFPPDAGGSVITQMLVNAYF